MGYIVLDTCVWIDLAATPALHELLDAIAQYAKPPPHQIVVPESVRIEWSRHREDCKNRWERGLKGHIKSLTTVYRAIPGTKDNLQRAQELAHQELQKGREAIIDGVARVDALMEMAENWRPSDADFRDVCDRCLTLRAPAVNNVRTSVGDCMLWRAVLALQASHCVWFCTANTSDFCNPKNTSELHPDLTAEAAGKTHQVYFSSDPSRLLEALLDASAVTEAQKAARDKALPRYYEHVPTPPGRCPNCQAAGKFTSGSYLPSRYGGLTWQYVCTSCMYRHDTGDFFD